MAGGGGRQRLHVVPPHSLAADAAAGPGGRDRLADDLHFLVGEDVAFGLVAGEAAKGDVVDLVPA